MASFVSGHRQAGRVARPGMKILHLVSCRGWSSDAYWAARISAEIERTGHHVTLVCKHGSESRVISRARDEGASRVETLRFASGMRPVSDARDVRRLVRWLEKTDIVHVHRGKEHWLAAMANRLASQPRPLVRTRHIVQPIRAHALNRWLYRRATSLVVTVTEAIRGQCLAADLLPPDRVLALPGGVDITRFHPGIDGAAARGALGRPPDVPLVGLVSGFRLMKGHQVAIEAASTLAKAGRSFQMVFLGQGGLESRVRQSIETAGLTSRIRMAGFTPDLPAAMAAFDIALYPALESDGMSRVLFEYLAMGKPVVASRVGAAPEVLRDGETGLLVPAGEAGALAQAIDRLLGDAPLGAELGRAAFELVRNRLSGAAVARVLATRYARLLGREGAETDEASYDMIHGPSEPVPPRA